MGDTFGARIDQLMAAIGPGPTKGRVEVDQVYAMPIERSFWEMYMGVVPGKPLHVHTGIDHFLWTAMVGHAATHIQHLADHVLDGEMSAIPDAMIWVVELVSSLVAEYAPIRTGRLRSSGHPTVTVEGLLYYDRAPLAPRDISIEGKGYQAKAAKSRSRKRRVHRRPVHMKGEPSLLRAHLAAEQQRQAEGRYHAWQSKHDLRESAAWRRKLRVLIVKLGGIMPTKDYEDIPRSVKRKHGLPYDYLAGELRSFGYHFDSFDALLAAITEPA